jgi:hypothetical protein
MASSDVERRLQRLEDAEEIRRLKALYGEYWDAGWTTSGSGQGLASLFTEDGVWDGRPVISDVLQGHQAIAEHCEAFVRFNTHTAEGEEREHPSLSMHMTSNPRIDLDGDRAQATFIGFLTTADPDRDQAYWCGGRYVDDLVRTADGWRFSRVRFHYAFFTPFDGQGWVKERFSGIEFAGADYGDAT